MMRRLPVYFLIDVSESMAGEPIREVQKGMKSVIDYLRGDPYALETVFASILVFAGSAEVLVPLTELYALTPPIFPIGSGTALGKGLELLMRQIDAEVRKSTPEAKGDWKPVVFIFTDGVATDDPVLAINRWREHYNKGCHLVIVTFGNRCDVPLLEKTGGQVLTLTDLGPDSFREFFKWISASIAVNSQAVLKQGETGAIPALKSCINLEKASPTAKLDDDWVILMGKCAKKGNAYLLKYIANPRAEKSQDSTNSAPYLLEGAYLINGDDYLRLGGKNAPKYDVNSALLDTVPKCPVCANATAIVQCNKCGSLFCGAAGSDSKCPWCGNLGHIEVASNLWLTRSQG